MTGPPTAQYHHSHHHPDRIEAHLIKGATKDTASHFVLITLDTTLHPSAEAEGTLFGIKTKNDSLFVILRGTRKTPSLDLGYKYLTCLILGVIHIERRI